MKAKRVVKNGAYCIEGAWSTDFRDRSSVRPVLDLLDLRGDMKYIYHTATTREELFFLVRKWVQKKYRRFPILYLATHGTREGICLYNFKSIALSELGDILAGKCKNKIIFMGSCLIFSSKPKILQEFLNKTGALAIMGYSVIVPWVSSTAFELLLLSTLQRHKLEGRALRFLTQKVDALSDKFPELQFKYLCRDNL